MATLMKVIVGASALASFVHAVPLRVLTVTDIVTVTTWKTVNSTSTVWVPANQSSAAATTSTLLSTSSAPVAVAATPSEAQPSAPTAASGGQFAQAPAPLPMSAFPGMSSTTQVVQPAPVVPTPSTTSVVVPAQPTTTPWTTSTTSAVVAPLPQTTAVVAASNSGGQCSPGAPCSGDVTHWDGGLGACGWNVNTASDMQIALPVGMMGSRSNGNPFCGRSVTLKNPKTGTTVQATVGDKCMGCSGSSIDCTDALFNAITDGTGDGRVSGMEWWFN